MSAIGRYTILLMVLLVSMVARATEPPTSAELSGVVRDSEGNALPYVTIFVEGTTRGTITDANGRYTLYTAEGDLRLTAQMLGYTSITHDVVARGSRTISSNSSTERKKYSLP